MSKERMRILEMLQDGKITVDEAMSLLARMPEDKEEKTRHNHKEDHDEDFSEYEYRREEKNNHWWNDTADSIKCAIDDALESLEDIDFPGIFSSGRGSQYMIFNHAPKGGSLNFLKLLAKNGTLKIKSHDDANIKVELKYSAKKNKSRIYLQEEGGGLDLVYDYNAFRYFSITCFLPRGLVIENIYAENKNSSIELEEVKGNHIELITKNSAIKMNDVHAAQITAQTTNSKIYLEGVYAAIVRATTTNAKVEAERSIIKQFYAKTTNSTVKIELKDGKGAIEDESEIEYILDLKTTNGNIKVEGARDVPLSLNASTSHGRIDFNYSDMFIHEMSQNYINCKSQGYDQASKKLKMNLSTSNANIKIV